MNMDMSFVTHGAWADAERELARRVALDISPAEGRLMDLLVEEVKQSDFTPDQILAEFEGSPETVVEFGARWYADCKV